MSKTITVVSGMARCGSTMMMQMLHAGGMEFLGNSKGYEDNRAFHVQKDALWLAEAQGKCIKIFDMQECDLPTEFEYKVIWMKRDYEQQALSHAKLLQLVVGITIGKTEIKELARNLPLEEKKAFDLMQERGIDYQVIHFEDVLRSPLHEAYIVTNFLKTDLDTHEMADVIVSRSANCAAGMDMERNKVNNAL